MGTGLVAPPRDCASHLPVDAVGGGAGRLYLSHFTRVFSLDGNRTVLDESLHALQVITVTNSVKSQSKSSHPDATPLSFLELTPLRNDDTTSSRQTSSRRFDCTCLSY